MDRFLPNDADSAQGADPQTLAQDVSQVGESPSSADSPSQADTTDYRALYEQAQQSLSQTQPRLQQAQQYEQAFGELKQLMAAAQAETAERQAQAAAQQRMDNVYRLAETMPPEDALRYIRQSEDMERANFQRSINEIRQQAQQREYAVAVQFAGPLYAQELARQHGLPPEYADRLAMVPPQHMDAYVPALKAEHTQRTALERDYQQKHQQLLDQIDQLQRGQQADSLSASGAHSGGGTGVPSGVNGAAAVQDGSTQGLLKVPGMADFLRGFMG